MSILCLSLPVHESPEVVKHQINNIKIFLPNTYIIVHVSLSSFQIKDEIIKLLADVEGVFVNPLSLPTRWGWVFHSHIFNYEYIKKLGLHFDYFLLDTSNSMLLRSGAENHITRFDFLSDCEHIRIEDFETTKDHWGFLAALRDDVCFLKMMDSLGSDEFYASGHEGSAYKRELFDEIYSIFARYYHFHLLEPRFPKEEVYLPSVARALSSNYSNPITWRAVFYRHKLKFGPTIEIVESLAKTGMYKYQDLEKEDPEYGKNYYGFKGVARKMDDPIRQYIDGLMRTTQVI